MPRWRDQKRWNGMDGGEGWRGGIGRGATDVKRGAFDSFSGGAGLGVSTYQSKWRGSRPVGRRRLATAAEGSRASHGRRSRAARQVEASKLGCEVRCWM